MLWSEAETGEANGGGSDGPFPANIGSSQCEPGNTNSRLRASLRELAMSAGGHRTCCSAGINEFGSIALNGRLPATGKFPWRGVNEDSICL